MIIQKVLNKTQTAFVISLTFALLDLLYRVISHELLLWPSSAVLNAWFDKSNELGYLYGAFSKTPALFLFKFFDYCEYLGINVYKTYITLDIISSALCKYFGLLVAFKVAKVSFDKKKYLIAPLIIILSIGGSFSQLFHGLNLAGWSFPLNVGFSNSGLGCLFGFVFLNQELSQKNGCFWALIALLIHPINGIIMISFYWIYAWIEWRIYPKFYTLFLCVLIGCIYKYVFDTETIDSFDIYINNSIRHPHHYLPSFYIQNLAVGHIFILVIHSVLLYRFPKLFTLYIIYTFAHVFQFLISEKFIFTFLYQLQPSRFWSVTHLLVLAAILRYSVTSFSPRDFKVVIVITFTIYFYKAYKTEHSGIKDLASQLEGRIVFVENGVENLENLRSYCRCKVFFDNNYPFTSGESRIWSERSNIRMSDLETLLDTSVIYITDSLLSNKGEWSHQKSGNYYLYEKR